ncbi:hypothetical protein ANO14919_071870 [Xylariales sp. No.14919]|nr:hypothetical protein ANO14919_071870 [Xylariales sp. No.14919]
MASAAWPLPKGGPPIVVTNRVTFELEANDPKFVANPPYTI